MKFLVVFRSHQIYLVGSYSSENQNQPNKFGGYKIRRNFFNDVLSKTK